MLDYSKPILREKPDIIIYHIGTNNLYTDDTPNEIARNIISHALEMKTETNKVLISSLIIRNDKLNDKREKVNEMLKAKFTKTNIKYINNNNNITKVHLNNSGLHTNIKGTITLAKNYIDSMK